MIEILNVSFKNFLCFGNRLQTVDFDKGVNLILGRIPSKERSNGSGKTSLLETIPFALFGRVTKDITKEQIINWKNKKNSEVRITLKKGEDVYIIERGIKPNTFNLYKNDVSVKESKSSVMDFQKFIDEEILGFDYKTFVHMVYSNLNSSTPILQMKKPDKRKFLEQLFDLEYFSQKTIELNAKIGKCNEKIEVFTSDKTYNLKYIDEKQQERLKVIEKIRLLSDDFTNKIKELRNKLIPLKVIESIEYLKIEKDNIEKEVSKVLLNIEKIELSKKYVNGIIKNLTEKARVCETYHKDLERKQKIEEEIKKYKTLEEYEFLIHEIQTNLFEYHKKMLEQESCIKTLIEKKQIQDKEFQKYKLLCEQDNDEVFECPTCLTMVESSKLQSVLNDRISLTEKTLEHIEKQLTTEKNLLKEIKYNKSLYSKERDSLETEKRLLEELVRKYNAIVLLDTIENAENVKQTVDKYLKILKKFEITNILLKNKLEEKKETISNIDQRIKDSESKKIEYERIIKEIDILEIKKIEEEKKRIELQESLEEFNNKIKETDDKNKEIENKINKLEELLSYFNYGKTICKDEHVKQYAISARLPYINTKVNEYLSKIDTPFFVTTDSFLDVTIKGPGILNCTYGNLSGGEARSIDIAIQLALLDIVRQESVSFPDMILLDELLDSSIDDIGLSNLLKIIKYKQMIDQNKIFLISHRKELENSDFFDNIYLVENQSGFGIIKRV